VGIWRGECVFAGVESREEPFMPIFIFKYGYMEAGKCVLAGEEQFMSIFILSMGIWRGNL
jgi:hypothetical protein